MSDLAHYPFPVPVETNLDRFLSWFKPMESPARKPRRHRRRYGIRARMLDRFRRQVEGRHAGMPGFSNSRLHMPDLCRLCGLGVPVVCA